MASDSALASTVLARVESDMGSTPMRVSKIVHSTADPSQARVTVVSADSSKSDALNVTARCVGEQWLIGSIQPF